MFPKATVNAASKFAFVIASAAVAAGCNGCASPGPPRAPSLQLPALVTDLTATRRGTYVALRFTLPQRATDNLPLRSQTLKASVCRAVDQGACIPLATAQASTFAALTDGHATVATLQDALNPSLTAGPPQLLTYRVELQNDAGHAAGFSDAAYAAAGAAPLAVEGLIAQGSRLGIVLTWKPSPPGVLANDDAEVVLRREDVGAEPVPAKAAAKPKYATAPGAAEARVVLLRTSTPGPETDTPKQPAVSPSQQNRTLDTTAAQNEPYVYSAERRRSVHLGGRTLEVISAASTNVAYTLQDIYPPPAPTDLAAASFAATSPATGVLVDLIWQPVDDPELAGYNVYRELLGGADTANAKQRLNEQPVRMPAFHDNLVDAKSMRRYRYSVTAVNSNGRESSDTSTTVDVPAP